MPEFTMTRRVLLAAAFLGASCLSAAADPRQDTLAAISRCAGLPDDRTFLDCVYGAAQPMRAELGLQPAPSFQTRLVPPAPGARTASAPPVASAASPMVASAQPPQQKTDGLFGGLFNSDNEETARMASYSFNPRGYFTVTLDNGQVWRQRANDMTFAQWGAKPADYYVTVRAQGTGRYSMSVRGNDGLFQVEPVR
jgi:hypothetical protein